MPDPNSSDGSKAPVLLTCEDCVLQLGDKREETIPLSLAVRSGEFVMLHAEDDQQEDAVSRAICGLQAPISGRVLFQGHDWRSLSLERSGALRGRIGTVFGEDIWSPYRTIMDGMILPQLHHTRRSLEAICSEATRWSLRFGLPGLPKDDPVSVSRQDRQSASFARAFLGRPHLIVIRHQYHALPPSLMSAVITAIWELREEGAAVLWFTRDETFKRDASIPVGRLVGIGGLHTTAMEAPGRETTSREAAT